MRPGTNSRWMIRTLLTSLCMPYAFRARASSSGKACSSMRRRPLVEIGDDLLRADHEDDPSGTARVGAELAPAVRGGQERPGLGDRVDAAEHDVRRRSQPTDLVPLGRPVQAADPQADRLVPPGCFELGGDAGHVERLRGTVVDLAPSGMRSRTIRLASSASAARITVMPCASSAAAVRRTLASSARLVKLRVVAGRSPGWCR